MTTPTERLSQGVAWERRVGNELARRGWTACLWGQGELPPGVAKALRQTRSPLRWLPDILAVRGQEVVLVDAKSGGGKDVHFIERASWDTARRLAASLGVEVHFAFSDMTTANAETVGNRATYHAGSSRGSGEPFLILAVADTFPFDQTFGAPL